MNDIRRSRETLRRTPTLLSHAELPLCLAAALALGVAACDSGNGGNTGGGGTGGTSAGGTSTGGTSTGGSGSSTGGTSNGGGGTGGSGAGGGAGAGGGGAVWQVVDLLDDKLPDGTTVTHKGESIVQGIWFADTSHGVVGLRQGNLASHGGAIERLGSPTKVEEVVVHGAENGSSMQDTNFVSFFPTSIGLVAGNDFGGEFVLSTDKGATFSHTQTGAAGTPGGITAWISKDTGGNWHYVDADGHTYVASQDPGPATVWTQTWGGGVNPPAGDCPDPYQGGFYLFDPQQSFFVSPDGQTMMYPRGTNGVPAGVCRSTDGGKTFLPVAFPNPPAAAAELRPRVIAFSDGTHGIAASLLDQASGGYVYVTSDGGATWTAGKLPDEITSSPDFPYVATGMFAPGGQTGYLAGTFGGTNGPVLLKTTDGGKTWSNLSAALDAVPASHVAIHTVFALDDKNVWIGGDQGALLYSASGGQ
jgi:hypothetical protein